MKLKYVYSTSTLSETYHIIIEYFHFVSVVKDDLKWHYLVYSSHNTSVILVLFMYHYNIH